MKAVKLYAFINLINYLMVKAFLSGYYYNFFIAFITLIIKFIAILVLFILFIAFSNPTKKKKIYI